MRISMSTATLYATIPSNVDRPVPVICFCSHMDTAPDFTGTNVKPQIVRNYSGGDIQLPGDQQQIIRVSDNPVLRDQIGNDIITSDGTTLLGADDKAGLAEIMSAAQFLVDNPEIKHGTVKLLFTTDEEIGRGVDKVDLTKLGAEFAYTVDGETAGHIEDETFSADGVEITIQGVAIHPGFAKGKMENAIKIAGAIISRLPKDVAPETTDGREGFVHPTGVTGSMEKAALSFIVRDFNDDGLATKEAMLQAIVRDVMAGYPGSSYTFKVRQQYRNMKAILDRHPGDRRQRHRGCPTRWHGAGARQYPRRHRWLAAVVHGPALRQHLRRRPRFPLAARMGQPAGHGEEASRHSSNSLKSGRSAVNLHLLAQSCLGPLLRRVSARAKICRTSKLSA